MVEMKVSSSNAKITRTKKFNMSPCKSVNFGKSVMAVSLSHHTPISINLSSIFKKIGQFFNHPNTVIKKTVTTIGNPDGSKNVITRSAAGNLLSIKEFDISHTPTLERTFENGKLSSVNTFKQQNGVVLGDTVESLNASGNKVKTIFDNEGNEHSIEKFSKEGKLAAKFKFENGIHATVYSEKEKPVGQIGFYTDRKNPNSISLIDSKGNKTAKVYYEHGETPVRIDKYNENGLPSEQINFEKGKPVSTIPFDANLLQQKPAKPNESDVEMILTTAKQLLNKALA